MAQPGHLWILITVFSSDLPGSRTHITINSLISRGTESKQCNADNPWLSNYKHTLNEDIVRTLEFLLLFLKHFFSPHKYLYHIQNVGLLERNQLKFMCPQEDLSKPHSSCFCLFSSVVWMIHTQVHHRKRIFFFICNLSIYRVLQVNFPTCPRDFPEPRFAKKQTKPETRLAVISP